MSFYGHRLHFKKALVNLLSVFRKAESTRNQRELRCKSASICLACCEDKGSTRQVQMQELHTGPHWNAEHCDDVLCTGVLFTLIWCVFHSLISESGLLVFLVSVEAQILTQSWFNLIGDVLGFKHWHLTNAFSDSTWIGTKPSLCTKWPASWEPLPRVRGHRRLLWHSYDNVFTSMENNTTGNKTCSVIFYRRKSQMKKDYLKWRCHHLHMPDLALTWYVNLQQDLNFTISFTCSN